MHRYETTGSLRRVIYILTENFTGDDRLTIQPAPAVSSATLRLLVIPVTVYSVWVLLLFLLAGSEMVFGRFDPSGLFLYTSAACIMTGQVAPLLCVRSAFLSGAVNMFQIGFRSFRRTVLTIALTSCSIYVIIVLFNPFGADRLAFVHAFLLLLPTAIASVMMCWALLGTHVQAYVRSAGAVISLTTGVLVTALLYGLASIAFGSPVLDRDLFITSVSFGFVGAFFFFAVRDVYATSLAAGTGSVFLMADRINPLYLQNAGQLVWISAGLAVCTLIGIHWYLSRNFVTIRIPED